MEFHIGSEIEKSDLEKAQDYVNQNGFSLEDAGDHWVIVPSNIPEPTPADIERDLTMAVQNYLDSRAAELGYDSCLSVCSYNNTGVPKFDREGAAFRAWRSQVWAFCYAYLDQVLAGEKPIPTAAELIDSLPPLDIPE